MPTGPTGAPVHQQPRSCPTCNGALTVRVVACESCGTEVHGQFRRCEFCGLDDDERRLLRVFLAARGNAKEIERYLGVSYPTARARIDGLIAAVDASDSQHQDTDRAGKRREVLDRVAAGDLEVGEALALLSRS
jgi:hypothetical protein